MPDRPKGCLGCALRAILIAMALLVIGVVSCEMLFPACRDSEQSLPSPNGRWLATKIDTVCTGFTFNPSFSLSVTVRDRRSWFARAETVFQAGADPAADIAWSRDNELVVTVDEGSDPRFTLHQAGDVRIRYRTKRDPAESSLRQWAEENAEPYRP